MANVKITELSSATTLGSTDVFPVVDVGSTQTRKVTVADLLRNTPDGTAGAPSIANAGDQDTGIYFPAENNVGVSTGGTQRLVIDNSGNVGIGTTSPTTPLQVHSSTTASTIRITNSTSGATSSDGLIIQASGNDAYIWNKENSFVSFGTNNAEQMRIDSSGRLLVGTTTEGAANADDLTLATTGHTGITIRSGTSSNGNIYFSDATTGTGEYSGYLQYRHDDNALAFGTLSSERMRIDSSGNVKIGTGSDRFSYLTPTTANLQIDGGIVFEPGSGNDVEIINYRSTGLVFGTSGAEKMRIDGSGRVGIGTSSPTTILHIEDDISGAASLIRNKNTSTDANSAAGIRLDTASDGTDRERARIVSSDDGANKGYLAFETRSTSLNERLRIDSSGKVGVGTTSPFRSIHVSGSSDQYVRITSTNSANAGIEFGDSDDPGRANLIYSNSTDSMFFTVNGSERARIDSSGRLLVGTSTSLAGGNKSIQLVDTGVVRTIMGRDDSTVSAGTAIGSFDWYGNGGDGSTWEEVASIEAEADGSHATGDKPGRLVFSTTADNASSSTERMRIDSSGRVGIGTASPSEKLEVQSSTNTTIRIDNEDDSTATLVFHNTGSTDRQISVNSGSMRFGGSSDEQMRIDSSGKVLIAKTSSNFANAGIELRENGEIVATRSAGDVITTRRLVSEGTHFSFRNISGTAVGTIVTTSSSTAYNTSSDYRLKENVVDIADGITRVKQLQPRRFNFIADDTTTIDGFLAHEAQTVVPEAVTGTHNEVDDDGNPVMQEIDQSKLVPLLTAALQEAIAKIETLEAKVAALEAQ